MSGYNGYVNDSFNYLNTTSNENEYGMGGVGVNGYSTASGAGSSANTASSGVGAAVSAAATSTNPGGGVNVSVNANDTTYNYLNINRNHNHNRHHNHAMNNNGMHVPGFYQHPITGMIMAQDGNGTGTGNNANAAASGVAARPGTSQTDYAMNAGMQAAAGYTMQQPALNLNMNNLNPNLMQAPNPYGNGGHDYLSQMRQQHQQSQVYDQQQDQSQQIYNHHHFPQQYERQNHQHQEHQDYGGGIDANNLNPLNAGFDQTQDPISYTRNNNDASTSQQQQQETDQGLSGSDMQHLEAHLDGRLDVEALSHALQNDSDLSINPHAPLNLNVNANMNANENNGIVDNNMFNNVTGLGGIGTGVGVTNSDNSNHALSLDNHMQYLDGGTSIASASAPVGSLDDNAQTTFNNSSNVNASANVNPKEARLDDTIEDALSKFSISITSLSIEPLSAHEIMQKVQIRTQEVVTRYLPCVEFLVLCQQELRNGLEMAIRRRGRGGFAMTANQFYNRFFAQLPARFHERNKLIMPVNELATAYKGLESLLCDVKEMELKRKHEAMKNAFLGGMRDGESWGLRKWLSKNGGALSICNDIELIWYGLRDKKEDPMVVELAKQLRPISKISFDRLKSDVPKAYQEVSSAHPYLPFFHRLESALRGLSEFDPEDDEVICLDDSDDEEDTKPVAVESSNDILNTFNFNHGDVAGNAKTDPDSFQNSAGSEIFDFASNNHSHWRCSLCTFQNDPSNIKCEMCDVERITNSVSNINLNESNLQELAGKIENIASALDEGREPRPLEYINELDFWSNPSENYVLVLRLFRKMLLSTTSHCLLDPISLSSHVEDDLERYYSLIKNPLGFRDIVVALANQDSDKTPGQLDTSTLKKWNMFEGKWLIQAVDLVLLNTLAFIGKDKTPLRKEILSLRKKFWKDIRAAGISETKKHMPPRRTENSDFLLYRSKK